MDILDKQKYIFGMLFLLANRLQVIGDRYMSMDGITTKQWFLTVIISQFGDHPPTLSEVADIMGSSRQNVKQLALKLEEKEFLRIERDEQDARALRLKLTEKCNKFWEKREAKDSQFIRDIFGNLSLEELDKMAEGSNKLLGTIGKMEKSFM